MEDKEHSELQNPQVFKEYGELKEIFLDKMMLVPSFREKFQVMILNDVADWWIDKIAKQKASLKQKALSCVPSEKLRLDKVDNDAREAGFNDCREQTLSALKEI